MRPWAGSFVIFCIPGTRKVTYLSTISFLTPLPFFNIFYPFFKKTKEGTSNENAIMGTIPGNDRKANMTRFIRFVNHKYRENHQGLSGTL